MTMQMRMIFHHHAELNELSVNEKGSGSLPQRQIHMIVRNCNAYVFPRHLRQWSTERH